MEKREKAEKIGTEILQNLNVPIQQIHDILTTEWDRLSTEHDKETIGLGVAIAVHKHCAGMLSAYFREESVKEVKQVELILNRLKEAGHWELKE